jgi:hypothetical protein
VRAISTAGGGSFVTVATFVRDEGSYESYASLHRPPQSLRQMAGRLAQALERIANLEDEVRALRSYVELIDQRRRAA